MEVEGVMVGLVEGGLRVVDTAAKDSAANFGVNKHL